MLSEPAEGKTLSFSDSTISAESATTWSAAAGVDAVLPLGILTSRVTAAGDREQTASLFGADSSFSRVCPNQMIPTEAGTVILSERSHEALLADIGDKIFIFGDTFTVAGVSQDSESATPV